MAIALPRMEGWKAGALRVLENMSRVWGGAGHLPFTQTQDPALNRTWFDVLTVYDPDYFGYYLPTFRGLQIADPDEFQRWVYQRAEEMAKESERDLQDFLPLLQEDHVLDAPRWNWQPSDDLSRRLLRHMSPYHWREDVFRHPVADEWTPTYEFVDVLYLERTDAPPVTPIDASVLGDDIQLLMGLRGGALSPAHHQLLLELNIEISPMQVSEANLGGALQWAWLPEDVPRGPSLIFNPSNPPLNQSRQGCDWFRPFRTWDQRPYFIVVGGEEDDFCLAGCLDRLYGGAAWIPGDLVLTEHPLKGVVMQALASTLWALSLPTRLERPLLVLSASVPAEQLQEFADELKSSSGLLTASEDRIRLQPLPLNPRELSPPQRLWDRTANLLPRYEPFINGRQETRIDTPVPTGARLSRTSLPGAEALAFRTHLTWQVEVWIEGSKLPARSVLSSLVREEDPFEESARVGTDGVSFFSQTGFVLSGAPLEKTLSRPRVRVPSVEEIFSALVRRSGLSYHISPAGRYTQAMLELWRGLTELTAAFTEPGINSLLHTFVAGRRDESAAGIFLDSVRRRFLTFRDAQVVSGLRDAELRNLLDRWAEWGIVRRGLALKCAHCNYATWYALGDLDEQFGCPRCGRVNRIALDTWKDPVSEPKWYYQLAEIAHQALANDIRASILTLATLADGAQSFLFVPEAEIRGADGAPLSEHDIWAIRDGRIVLGEANTTGTFDGSPRQRIQKLVRAADATTADTIVLGTTAGSWSTAVVERIREAFNGKREEVQLIAGLGQANDPSIADSSNPGADRGEAQREDGPST
jgi:hypothetical protein